MRLGSIFMTLFAIGLAALAGMMSKTWLEQQRLKGAPVVVERTAPATKIVIATQALRFGQELGPTSLKEIEWPVGAIPSGAFASVGELLKPNERRVVLSAIEQNEPILKWKITGPGQRASLSALIEDGKKAVTVRVNDVLGVGGFVLPGDRVDVLMTKMGTTGADRNPANSFTDVILQGIRVLGVDQLADDRVEKPSVVKAVTLELTTAEAQKVTLAATMGTLSLMLRPAGSTQVSRAPRITASAIEYESGLPPAPLVVARDEAPKPEPAQIDDRPRNRQIVVTRAVRRFDYSVPFDQ